MARKIFLEGGWTVQLDYDEEMGPLHGMYGSVEAEFEVQRTIKRAELTAFLCLLKRVIGPIEVYVDNNGIFDGLRRGEREHQAKSRRCRFMDQILGRTALPGRKDILVEVGHVTAHRTKKEKKDMSHFEKFVTEGNEKAVQLAKEGALLDELFMAEARAETMQQEREEVSAALQYAASFHCSVEEWKTVKNSSRSRKKSGFFCGSEEGGDEASDGMVCGRRLVSMH